MGMMVKRGDQRTAKPDLFLSHSSKDADAASHLATTLNFCAVDVWLDAWELEIGLRLTDAIEKAMDASRYITILITENYNKTVWTKKEYQKALAREQREGRAVMLPLIIGNAEIPDFIADKIYIDLRTDVFAGIFRLVGMVKGITPFRISQALGGQKPETVKDVWGLLRGVAFEPYVVLGEDDFLEMVGNGAQLIKDGYAEFSPGALLENPRVSKHVKSLVRELL